MNGRNRVIIENVRPQVNCGEFPVKRIINDELVVNADIICDGHDAIRAEVKFRHKDEKAWKTTEMVQGINDLWTGNFKVDKMGVYLFR